MFSTLHPQAGDALRDYLKPHLRLFGTWGRRHLLQCAKGLLLGRTSILSQAGRHVLRRKTGKTVRLRSRLDEWVKMMSRFLHMLPWDHMECRHFLRLRKRQENWQLVIHDLSDIAKPWAEKMEGLSQIRDGSTGQIVNGYTLALSIAFTGEHWGIDPIALDLEDPLNEDYRCEGDLMKRQFQRTLEWELGRDVLHVFDRGFDDEKWFYFLDARNIPWMIRLRENRLVTFRGEEHPLRTVAETMLSERTHTSGDCVYTRADIGVTITHDGSGKKIRPDIRTYALVVIRRPGREKPMLLLLNERVKDLRAMVKLYRHYLERWEIEGYIRYLKEILKVEGVRVMAFQTIQNLLRLQMLMSDFLLQEFRKGKLPLGGGIFESFSMHWNPAARDTRQASPYLFAEIMSESLRAEQEYGYSGRTWQERRPALSKQMSLFALEDPDTA